MVRTKVLVKRSCYLKHCVGGVIAIRLEQGYQTGSPSPSNRSALHFWSLDEHLAARGMYHVQGNDLDVSVTETLNGPYAVIICATNARIMGGRDIGTNGRVSQVQKELLVVARNVLAHANDEGGV